MPALIAFLEVFLIRILKFVFAVTVLRFLLFGTIFLTATEIVPVLISVFLPENISVSDLLADIDPQVGFILQFFEIPYAVHTILSAYVMRFAIRRLPFVG